MPLSCRPTDPPEPELAAHLADGVLGDEHRAGRGGRLQPGRAVGGVADGEQVARGQVGESGDHDLAAVDAHAHAQRDAVAAAQGGAELLDPRPHGERGAHRTGGVVLAGPVQPEDGHHRVADELLDDPALALDGRPEDGDVAAHHLLQVLGVEPAGQRRRVDEVGEQHRDELALLPDRRDQQPVAPLDQRGERRVGHLVAQHAPLTLERGDRLLEGGELTRIGHRGAPLPPARRRAAVLSSPR